MGLKDLFGKGKKMAAENKDQVTQGIEKAADIVDEKTGGQHTEHIDKGEAAAKDFVEGLDDK